MTTIKNKIKEQVLELSFSAIETFNQCPRKYYYNYVLKLPRGTWPWLILGTFCHLVLEKFHRYVIYFNKRKLNYNYNEMMKRAYLSAQRIYFKKKKNKNFDITEEQLTQSKNILSDYLKKIIKNFPNTILVEKGFRIKIGKYVIRGFIDRVDKLDSKTYEVIDYKTSSNVYDVNKNYQVSLYAYAFKKIKNLPDADIRVKLDFIKLKKERSGLYDNETGKLIEKYITDAGDKISEAKLKYSEDENEWEAVENPFCKFCDFKNRCFNQREIFK